MSIIGSILKPYKALFKDSKEQPKEVGMKPEVETTEEKPVEEASSAKLKPVNQPKTIAPSNNRAGKVLWKKK